MCNETLKTPISQSSNKRVKNFAGHYSEGALVLAKKTTTSYASVIRQKGESENGCFKKTKHVKFSEKRTFLTP